MKLRPSRHRAVPVHAPEPKPVGAAPAAARPLPQPPLRVWSLLLPQGYTNDRRR